MKSIALIALAIPSSLMATLPHDDEIVAATLILEAGGEYADGAMEAVYEVIARRADQRRIALVDVCLQPLQFSCWNSVDIERQIERAKRHPRWATAWGIVTALEKTNYTHGADHYHADYVSPSWARSMTKTTQIGRHIFYKS